MSSCLIFSLLFLSVIRCVLSFENRDFYNILKVTKAANIREIKQSYRKLATELHPDKNPNDASAGKKFQDLTDAYEVLSNEEKRNLYDLCGEKCVKNNDEGLSFESLFENFVFKKPPKIKLHKNNFYYFDDGKGPNIVMRLFVTLEEFYYGQEIIIVRQTLIQKPIPGETRKCNCRQEYEPQLIKDGVYTVKQNRVCEECESFELVPEDIYLTVNIEPGMNNGVAILFEEYGELSSDGDGKAGDLIIELIELNHSKFQRIINDLYVNATISLQNALCGFNLKLRHLDNREINIKIEEIIKPGQQIEVKNEGMPIYGSIDYIGKGSLFLTFDIEFPEKLSMNSKYQIVNALSQSNEVVFYNGFVLN